MLREKTATVLPFRDSALRRPIDVAAWTSTQAPKVTDSAVMRDNVIPLERFARASRRGGCRTWLGGPPGGEAA